MGFKKINISKKEYKNKKLIEFKKGNIKVSFEDRYIPCPKSPLTQKF